MVFCKLHAFFAPDVSSFHYMRARRRDSTREQLFTLEVGRIGLPGFGLIFFHLQDPVLDTEEDP